MTLDEAIEHARRDADRLERECKKLLCCRSLAVDSLAGRTERTEKQGQLRFREVMIKWLKNKIKIFYLKYVNYWLLLGFLEIPLS